MVALKHKDMKIIDDAFDMNGGYVLDFTNRTFAEFFEDEFELNIYDQQYQCDGTSKAKILRVFIKKEGNELVAKVLRKLWGYKDSMQKQQSDSNLVWVDPSMQKSVQDTKTPLFDLINKIEGSNSVPRTDMLEKFAHDETLKELIAAIERDIQANKPAAALDRLHTYCMKKIAHLINKHGGSYTRDETLHSRMGKYIKLLEGQRSLNDVSKLCLKSSISIFEKFNSVRNNDSFAHDNQLLNQAESRYVFDVITSLLRFIKTIEAEKYE